MKHDTKANWDKATNFTPLEGELIVYDKGEGDANPRMKVGDGTTKVSALPFLGAEGGVAVTAVAVTLTADGWSEETQTVTVEGVTADTTTCHVVVSAAPESVPTWSGNGVVCSAQGAGTLTFTCSAAPEEDLTANVLIMEAAE